MRIFKGREPAALDEIGDETVVWEHIAGVPCVVHNASQYALLKLGIQSQVTHVIFCEYLDALVSDPKARWRCDVTEYPGVVRTYIMVQPLDHMGRQHHLELAVRRLDELPINVIVISAGGIPSEEVVST